MTELDPYRAAEARALGRLTGVEVGSAVDGVAAVHRAISDRVFAAVRLGVGPAAAPVKVAHDAISQAVYRTIGMTAGVVGRVAGEAGGLAGVTPSRTALGAGVLSAVQGLIGDTLADHEPLLASPMTLRMDGAPVPPAAAAEHCERVRGRLVIFLHGLAESEYAWRWGGRTAYGELLEHDLDCTSLQVRYNTGLRIHDNGADLAELVDALVESWPLPVESIAFVGHSMGGLVVRSACHQAVAAGASWVDHVTHVVCLGSPHAGAPLEQFVHYAATALELLPETRPFARLLRRRSAGIRDLRHAALVESDWDGVDPEALSRPPVTELPPLPGSAYYYVGATLTENPEHLVGKLIGDGLVRVASATGSGGTHEIEFAVAALLPGAHHLALLNHPTVYHYLLEWLKA
ncbi:esterase/lipase family protein [Nocardia stercoris]|uniref:Alpha/beta hydrolase n=1 Tax=Nocardia stercoris TaxID=2483361 RepID=A0A3M2KS29_9NOCA|nr:alpha/beta fold hydrolase [Nocardia stercoris]RMI27881.1 alpha/beta hydrolase [Nocardia stercoris]